MEILLAANHYIHLCKGVSFMQGKHSRSCRSQCKDPMNPGAPLIRSAMNSTMVTNKGSPSVNLHRKLVENEQKQTEEEYFISRFINLNGNTSMFFG
jgi:hypothetical protein